MKLAVFLIIFLTQISCSLKKIDYVHGVPNLKNKTSLIKLNNSNKNDVIKFLGPSLIVNNPENKWAYMEVRQTRNNFGKKHIYLNDYTEIYFDKYGVVKKINFYDLKLLKNIKFTEEKTEVLAINETMLKNILSSTRKRIENKMNKNK